MLELFLVPLRMSPKGDLSSEPFLTCASPLAAPLTQPRSEGGFGYMDGTGQRWRPPGKAQARGGNWSKSPSFGADSMLFSLKNETHRKILQNKTFRSAPDKPALPWLPIARPSPKTAAELAHPVPLTKNHQENAIPPKFKAGPGVGVTHNPGHDSVSQIKK